jgi:hypothetical protein
MTDLADFVTTLVTESFAGGNPPAVLAERVDYQALTDTRNRT